MKIEKTTLVIVVVSLLLILAGGSGLHFPPLPLPAPNPPGPVDPEKPAANIKAAAHAAVVAYSQDVSAYCRKLADAPPATVREALTAMREADVVARDKYTKSLAAIMQPNIGSEALDPAAAKKTFGGMADGFAGVK